MLVPLALVAALPLVFVETVEVAAAGEGEDLVFATPVVAVVVAVVAGVVFPLGCFCCSWSKPRSAAACEMPRSWREGKGVPEIQAFLFRSLWSCNALSQKD